MRYHGSGLLVIVFYCTWAILFILMHNCAVKDFLGSIDDHSTLVDFSHHQGALKILSPAKIQLSYVSVIVIFAVLRALEVASKRILRVSMSLQ
jgi:hypothetical protein